jgi:hypothetical protein
MAEKSKGSQGNVKKPAAMSLKEKRAAKKSKGSSSKDA